MSDRQAVQDLQDGWSFVMSQGAMIALFPIEDWLEALERAETVGPILDPTLFRDYLYCGKGPIIKDVLRAALTLKQAVVKAQQQITADPKLRGEGAEGR